jgi:hypothetical protein
LPCLVAKPRGRLRAVLDTVEIGEFDPDVRLYLQQIIQRHDMLRARDAKRFKSRAMRK